jgi:RHS repeat-associated protein
MSAVQWEVPSPNGVTQPYLFCYAQVLVNIATTSEITGEVETLVKLQSIVLPNGQAWGFTYNDTDGTNWEGNPVNYGTLTQINLPTGGTISYTYSTLGPTSIGCQNEGRWVATRTVTDNTGPHEWQYQYSTSGTPTTTVIDPLENQTVHTFGTYSAAACSLYETGTQYNQNGGSLLKTVTTQYSSTPNSVNTNDGLTNVVPTSVTTTWPNNQSAQQVMTYDTGFTYTPYTGGNPATGIFGKKLTESDYDYSGGLLKQTVTTYQGVSNPTYQGFNFLDLMSSQTILNGNGGQVAATTYSYDQNGLQPSNISTQHNSTPPDGSTRGNKTTTSKWISGSSYSNTAGTYYDTGQVYTVTDPVSDTTTITYSSTYAGALPTSITDALGHVTTYAYDFNTGLLTSMTDVNQQATSYSYDSLSRLTSVVYPTGGGTINISRQETTLPYSETETRSLTATQNLVTTTIFDGLGRVTEKQTVSDPQGTVYVDTTYDGDGRVASVSNPYRAGGSPTDGTTQYSYDGLGRTTQVTDPDNSTVITQYCGNATKVTDEAGKWRRSETDGLGRLEEVDEPNSTTASAGACPSQGDPVWQTLNGHDALGNLLSVVQNSSRSRSFAYDGLSRLTSATNPENGTVTYVYDAASRLTTKTDARGSGYAITYTYDADNDLVGKSYANGDPAVTYNYNQTTANGYPISNPIHHRTSMTDAAGIETWFYDAMGRATDDIRENNLTQGYVENTATYTYNYDGSPATIAYPGGGHIFTYTIDSAGRASSLVSVSRRITTNYVTGTCGDSGTGACYAPPGELTSAVYGGSTNLTAINLADYFNNRLQPCRLSAGTATVPSTCTAGSAGNVMDLSYSFSAGAGDNGNVVGITNNLNSSRSESFSYDQLNRLKFGGTSATTGSYCWGTNFITDTWGNLTSMAGASGYGACTGPNLSVTATSNNQVSGYSYTASGDMTFDGLTTYTYDSENRIATAAGVTYTYDGDGRRTVKSNGTMYWYGLSDSPLVEFSLMPYLAVQNQYVYFGGKRVARIDSASNITFYFEDYLGSSRLMADSTGAVCYDADFYPYGGERPYTTTCQQDYKFTGKERDAESGLDDFDARFYSSSLGRFMSADWSAIPAPVPYANLTNPQTLNLYAMVRDNPESFADLNGHYLQAPSEYQGSTSGGDDPFTQASFSNDFRDIDKVADSYYQQVAADQAQNTAPAQTNNPKEDTLTNVVYNETGSLSANSKAKPGTNGSADQLSQARVEVAEAAERVLESKYPGRVQADRTLSDHALKDLAGGNKTVIAALKDSRSAAESALGGSNLSHGAMHYITSHHIVKTLYGHKAEHFGPFTNALGGKTYIIVAP